MSSQPPVFTPISGAAFKVGIVAARYNERLVDSLLAQTRAVLAESGVKDRHIFLARVPGSGELPAAAQLVAGRRKPDVIVALGVLIRGGTLHYDLVARAVADALQRVALDERIPVINGVIVAGTQAQAAARCQGPAGRGPEFARSALAMAELSRTF